MKRALLVLVVSACALSACAGKVPETRFYQLAAPKAASPDNAGVSLVIESLDTESAYDDERMVYRLTPYRLDYYNYHRWSSAPGALVGNFLEQAFEASGRFRAVTREPNPAAPVVLGGRVIALEEVDKSKTEWVGHVVIELTLTDSATGDVIWSQQYEENEPLPEQKPEGLAKALSKALERIASRALPVVAERATEVAKAQDAAKATASRSARLKP